MLLKALEAKLPYPMDNEASSEVFKRETAAKWSEAEPPQHLPLAITAFWVYSRFSVEVDTPVTVCILFRNLRYSRNPLIKLLCS